MFNKNIFQNLKCKFNFHDYEIILPEKPNKYYEQVECSCGYIFKSLKDIYKHLKLKAPKCKFNRICLRCNHIDLRLDREVQRIIEQENLAELERKRKIKAKQFFKENHKS